MAQKITLKDLINDIDPEIKKLLSIDFREEELNKRPHVVDISKTSLKVNNRDGQIFNFDELYDTFIEVIKSKAARTVSNISEIGKNYFQGSTPYLIFVNNPGQELLLAKSFKPISTFLKEVVRDPKLINTEFGVQTIKEQKLDAKKRPLPDEFKVTEVSKLNIGHIASNFEEDPTGSLVSPLQQKVGAILDHLEISGAPTKAIDLATEAFNNLNEIQADFEYTIRNKTSELLQGVGSLFGEQFVTVTIHTVDVNQKEFNPVEAKIYTDFVRNIGILLADPKYVKKFLELEGSNTIFQDIEQALISNLKTGKFILNSHPDRKVSTGKKTIGNKGKVGTGTTVEANFAKPQASSTISTYEENVDLLNLKMLLDLHLQDVISANMGSGERKDILNYRTGRFAGSAKVERLTMSKQGMITAFYNYMKYPYATFSEGGKQSKPTSRDPKLLIAKSIREIVTEKVAARLRAVVV
jgi:hypothetical protein